MYPILSFPGFTGSSVVSLSETILPVQDEIHTGGVEWEDVKVGTGAIGSSDGCGPRNPKVMGSWGYVRLNI